MIHLKNVRDALPICEAIGSAVRMEMLEQVLLHKTVNLDTLAKTLHLTNGALTRHVKKLIDAGLIRVITISGKRGAQKQCAIAVDKVLIDLSSGFFDENTYNFDIPVGQYGECRAEPYCGLVTTSGFLGERDDPKYFSFPDHVRAAALWLRRGHLTYLLPTPLKPKQNLKTVKISLEFSSKAPGFGKHSSDIQFTLCGVPLGTYTVYGEFNDRRGLLTPDWYDSGFAQYGAYKTITVDRNGTYIDGIKLSSVTIDKLNFEKNSLVISVHDSGLMLFGQGFGDYDCGIRYTVEYEG